MKNAALFLLLFVSWAAGCGGSSKATPPGSAGHGGAAGGIAGIGGAADGTGGSGAGATGGGADATGGGADASGGSAGATGGGASASGGSAGATGSGASASGGSAGATGGSAGAGGAGAGTGGGGAGAGGGNAGAGGTGGSNVTPLIAHFATGQPVRTVAIASGTIYFGGFFSASTQLGTGALAALDEVTLAPTTNWHAQVMPFVNAIVVNGGTVFAGMNLNGNTLLALDAVTGNPTTTYSGANNAVTALAVGGGTIYLAGIFDHVGSQARNEFGAVDAATGAVQAWSPSDSYNNGWATAMTVVGNKVYLAGNFKLTSGSATRTGLAAVDAATGAFADWNPAVGNAVALAVGGNTLFVGGHFTSASAQTRNNLAAFDLTTGALTSWDPNADGDVRALAVRGDNVIIAGSFATVGGQPRSGLAAVNATTGAVASWAPPLPITTELVYALAASDRVVVVGQNGGATFFTPP